MSLQLEQLNKSGQTEIVSIDECKQYLSKYNLNDQKIELIKNVLIGVTGSIINSYLSDFES